MPTITPQFIQELAYSVTTDVMNRGESIAIDRKEMPMLDFLWGKRTTDAGNANNKTRVNLKYAGDQRLQYWSGRDVLGFQENYIDLFLEFDFVNIHLGLEFVHTDLMAEGYSIAYNQPRSEKFARKIPADDINRLANIFEEKIETHLDNFKVLLDRELHVTDSATGLAGLDSLISVDPTAGTIGGKTRAGNVLLQHIAYTGLTTTAGGDMQLKMTKGIRRANLNGRGRSARVDRLFAGSKFLDGYLRWFQNNGIKYDVDIARTGKIDAGVTDAERYFLNIPIVYDPTLDYLASIGTADNGIPWDCRAYGIASKALQVRTPSKMDLQTSFPPDPSDQRFTRMSTDSRLTVVNMIPNAHVLFSVDPTSL